MHEIRSILLADDGRHVTLGRHAEPTESEIAAAAATLRAQGIGAWLVEMHGDYYRGQIRLVMVREIAPARGEYAAAAAAFHATRKAARRR